LLRIAVKAQTEDTHAYQHKVPQLSRSNFLLNLIFLDFSGVERKLSLTKPGLDRNKSAFELCSKNTVNEEPTSALRKTSSVANYNIEDHSSIPRQGSSSFLSSAFHFVTGNNSSLAIQKIPEEEDGGLKMMVTGSSFSPSALTSSGSLHVDPIVHNNPTHLSGNNLADIDALTEKNKVSI
jgi:hypothetical protein